MFFKICHRTEFNPKGLPGEKKKDYFNLQNYHLNTIVTPVACGGMAGAPRLKAV
jgi:hypothetical protein